MANDTAKLLIMTWAILPTAFTVAMENSPADLSAERADSVLTDDMSFSVAEFDLPIVLSASRLRQSQLDSPASVTVIDSETITALGFKDIEDIFRLVPGMLVGYHSGFGKKTPSVSYHGTQAAEHRRLQVLIDGHSVFKPGLARVEWTDIPLAIEDIARIEVIRGPNSATYGANSYLGTINIITKHPQAEKGIRLKLRAGSRSVADSYLNIAGTLANTDVRWTLASKKDSGFDTLTNGIDDNRDSLHSTHTMLRTFTQLTEHASMEWQAGFKTGTNLQRQLHTDELVYNSEEDIDAQDVFIWQKLNYEFTNNQFSHLQVYSHNFIRTQQWNACFTSDFADAIDMPVLCGDFNKNMEETKSEIEFQHTSIWNDDLRTVAGLRFRLDEFNSETYNGGSSENFNSSIFTNIEYKIAPNLTINLGAMYEDDEINGDFLSPRLALNISIFPLQTIRLIYAEAIRVPDLFEQDGQLILLMRNIDGLNEPLPLEFGKAQSDTLGSEKIYSQEISYFGLLPAIAAQVDVKLFHEVLTGLISESLNHEDPLSNDNKITMKGIESQITVTLSPVNKIMASVAYVDTKDDYDGNNDSIKFETRLSADRSGSLSWIHTVDEHTQFASSYYHVENWNKKYSNNLGFTFSRLDLHLSHELSLDRQYRVNFTGTLQYRIDDDPTLYVKNVYDDKMHFYLSAELSF